MPTRTPRLVRLQADSRLHELASSGLLQKLGHAELVVYLKLVGKSLFGRDVVARNAELHTERTAQRALRSLEDLKLIRVRYRRSQRVIQVLK